MFSKKLLRRLRTTGEEVAGALSGTLDEATKASLDALAVRKDQISELLSTPDVEVELEDGKLEVSVDLPLVEVSVPVDAPMEQVNALVLEQVMKAWVEVNPLLAKAVEDAKLGD